MFRKSLKSLKTDTLSNFKKYGTYSKLSKSTALIMATPIKTLFDI